MDAIGHTLYGHIVDEINALHSTLVLVLALVVETRHSIVEVGNVSETNLESRLYIGVAGSGVSDAGQDALLGTILTELQCTCQLGSCIPACQAR